MTGDVIVQRRLHNLIVEKPMEKVLDRAHIAISLFVTQTKLPANAPAEWTRIPLPETLAEAALVGVKEGPYTSVEDALIDLEEMILPLAGVAYRSDVEHTRLSDNLWCYDAEDECIAIPWGEVSVMGKAEDGTSLGSIATAYRYTPVAYRKATNDVVTMALGKKNPLQVILDDYPVVAEIAYRATPRNRLEDTPWVFRRDDIEADLDHIPWDAEQLVLKDEECTWSFLARYDQGGDDNLEPFPISDIWRATVKDGTTVDILAWDARSSGMIGHPPAPVAKFLEMNSAEADVIVAIAKRVLKNGVTLCYADQLHGDRNWTEEHLDLSSNNLRLRLTGTRS